MWKFDVHVIEGAPGFCDTDSFESTWFSNFHDAFRAYVQFNPKSRWPQLRRVTHESFVYEDASGGKHVNHARKGMISYTDSLTDLGVSEDEFNRVIASCS